MMMAKDFAEHAHDSWAMIKIDSGWTCGPSYDEDEKKHPNLKQFNKLHERVDFFNYTDVCLCLKAGKGHILIVLGTFPGTLQVTETRRRSNQGDAGLGGCHRNR